MRKLSTIKWLPHGNTWADEIHTQGIDFIIVEIWLSIIYHRLLYLINYISKNQSTSSHLGKKVRRKMYKRPVWRFFHIKTSFKFSEYSKHWHFLKEKFIYKNEPQKPQNLKKMLRTFPASNAWTAVFKNADFSKSSLKVTKLSKFWHFSYYLFIDFSMQNCHTSLYNLNPRKGNSSLKTLEFTLKWTTNRK